ncbi:hypothetical protein MMC34_002705 [Xylographa carneopallida]|nr:hypothetical protein [Xylographa carneopallida]
MRLSSNFTIPAGPAITKPMRPDTGVPIWLDIVIGVFFGVMAVGCLAIYLLHRQRSERGPRSMSQKEADILSHDARKFDQYDDFVFGPRVAGFKTYAIEMGKLRYVRM